MASTLMRAVVYSHADPQGVRVVGKDLPVFNATSRKNKGKLACRVHYVGINPVDAKFLIGDKLPHALHGLGRRLVVEGKTVGFDFAGTVEEVPEGCTKYKPRDEVFGTMPLFEGSFCERVIADMTQIAHKPSKLSFAEAAALPLVGLTSLQALVHDNHLSEGQHLLLIGASGGVGHVALQVAKAKGARVTAVCSTRNVQFVKELGADSVVDYTGGDDAVVAQIAQVVGEHGAFDLCFDTVSSLEEKDKHFNYERLVCAKREPKSFLNGKYITIGGGTSGWIMAGLKRTMGIDLFPSGKQLFWIRMPNSAGALEELAAIVEKGKLRPKVAHEGAFNDEGVQKAFEALHNRRVVGKQVIKIAP